MDTEETFFLALKSYRESNSIQIEEISDFTKINPKYLNAIEEGNFNVIPNVYMRLFIRSYAKYIGADYNQALVDYELYTTGKIEPKFSDTPDNIELNNKKSSSEGSISPENGFQINYKQVSTIIFTIITIFILFKLISSISNDSSNSQNEISIPENTETKINQSIENDDSSDLDSFIDLTLLTNKNFEKKNLYFQNTEILFAETPVNLELNVLQKTKLSIVSWQKNGALFF